MYSELECGICYQTYNAGLRCPRELHCKHSFCESCLLALSRPYGSEEARLGAARLIVCPLCRHNTSISGEGKVRADLRVDEHVLERLVAEGVLEEEEDEPQTEEEEENGQDQDGCDDREEVTLTENDAEESDSSVGSSGGRHRRFWLKVWRKINGTKSRKRSGQNFLSNDDLKNFAMMSIHMF